MNMLLTSLGSVGIVKNCDPGLENAAQAVFHDIAEDLSRPITYISHTILQ